MLQPTNRFIALALTSITSILITACGTPSPPHQPAAIHITPTTTTTSAPMPTTTTIDPTAIALVQRVRLWNDTIKWNNTAKWNAARATTHVRVLPGEQPTSIEIGTATNITIDSVLACIRAHESGDYGEHSHLGSGSGAFQYVPGTWRTWSARAGYPGYAYAYLAPPSVQDEVTRYTLTHGGAGNWSTKYGNDPCTSGLGG